MKKTRVAIHIPSLVGGGAERTFVTVANGIADAGFSVDLVLDRFIGDYVDELNENVRVVELIDSKNQTIPILRFDNAGKTFAKRIVRRVYVVLALVRYLKSKKPQVLIAALPDPIINSVLARKLSRISFRLIASQRNNFSMQHPGLSTLGKIQRSLVKWALRGADDVVAISKGVAKDLENEADICASKVQVIYNPVLDSNFFNKSRESVEDEWFKSAIYKFVYVGRLVEIKRVGDVIKAFSILTKEVPAQLSILGQGPLRNELETLARDLAVSDNVKFFGFQQNPYKFIKASDCLILASEHEGFGNVLVQAMALGTRVISSDCDYGPREILDHGKYGELFPIGDVEGLAKKMETVLKSSPNPAFQSHANQYSWKNVGKQWISLIKNI